MSAEEKKDLAELIATLGQLNATGLVLVQNSADTLLLYQRMKEKDETAKEE